MSWQSNFIFIILRNILRETGLNKLILKIISSKGYETKFEKMWLNHLKNGDYIWDIGANIGYYTKLFSRHVGLSGKIFAFEPSPKNFFTLASNCSSLKNVTLFQIGLGEENKKNRFIQGNDELGATSRIIDDDKNGELIEVKSGSYLIQNGIVPIPDAIKIDVEGYEYEVLLGLNEYLKNPKIRIVGVEIHFNILKKRGKQFAPKWIEKLLICNGFKIYWTDLNHIFAIRLFKCNI